MCTIGATHGSARRACVWLRLHLGLQLYLYLRVRVSLSLYLWRRCDCSMCNSHIIRCGRTSVGGGTSTRGRGIDVAMLRFILTFTRTLP